MIAGHLPGHRGDRYLFHVGSDVGSTQERGSRPAQTSLRRSLLAMRAIAHRSGARASVDIRSRAVTVSSGPRTGARPPRLAPRTPFACPSLSRAPARSSAHWRSPCSSRFSRRARRPCSASARTRRRRRRGRCVCGSPTTGIARSRNGFGNDTTYDSDRQFRASTIGLELGVLKRFSIGRTVPWVTTKALAFVSPHTHITAWIRCVDGHGELLDTLLDNRAATAGGTSRRSARSCGSASRGSRRGWRCAKGVHVRSAIVGGALLGTGIAERSRRSVRHRHERPCARTRRAIGDGCHRRHAFLRIDRRSLREADVRQRARRRAPGRQSIRERSRRPSSPSASSAASTRSS